MTKLVPGQGGVKLTAAEIRSFRDNGFIAVERLTTDDEITRLGEVYDDLYAHRTGMLDGVFDLTQPYGTTSEPRLGQLLFPELRFEQIRDTALWRNARAVAAQLLAVAEGDLESWGHLIAKPPHSPAVTPWHQDEAYWDPALHYEAVGVWAPMDDATVDNGCLWFIPGSHRRDVLDHRHLHDDPSIHVLEVAEPIDCTDAVAVPVRRGGATFHHPRLLHYSGPNTTDGRRRAWANEFQSAPERREPPAHRPWVTAGEKALAAAAASATRPQPPHAP
jgi:Phytanoyl-CoA dioxygenase (PhyH)